MDPKIAKVINTLIQGTEQKKLSWEKAQERRAEFRLKLQHGWIAVDKWDWNDPETEASGRSVDITFANPQGEPIDSYAFSDGEAPEDFAYVMRLHDAARRNALKVDEALSSLLGELENKTKQS